MSADRQTQGSHATVRANAERPGHDPDPPGHRRASPLASAHRRGGLSPEMRQRGIGGLGSMYTRESNTSCWPALCRARKESMTSHGRMAPEPRTHQKEMGRGNHLGSSTKYRD